MSKNVKAENLKTNFKNNKKTPSKNKDNYSEISYTNNSFLNEPSISYQPSISNLSYYSNITNAPQKDLKLAIGPLSKREISIQQLLETINDIYNSKLENDKKLAQNNQQRFTMEQFLYYYLSNKCGLKNLVIEYDSSIIQGIREFSKNIVKFYF